MYDKLYLKYKYKCILLKLKKKLNNLNNDDDILTVKQQYNSTLKKLNTIINFQNGGSKDIETTENINIINQDNHNNNYTLSNEHQNYKISYDESSIDLSMLQDKIEQNYSDNIIDKNRQNSETNNKVEILNKDKSNMIIPLSLSPIDINVIMKDIPLDPNIFS